MIFLLLILGSVVDICLGSGWNLGGYGGQTYQDLTWDHDSNHGSGFSFGEIDLTSNIKPQYSSDGGYQPPKALQQWLTDVVVGKNSNSPIKPVLKVIGYPVRQDVEVKIPYPQVQQVAQPYPILIPMLHPVPYEVIKTVVKTVEKKVPTPVEKIVPVPVDKPVPFEVVKHVPVFVEKKFPIKIPIYKTIHHNVH